MAVGVLGCRRAEGPPRPYRTPPFQEPPWLNVRVDTVRVSPTRPGSNATWDGPAPTGEDGAGCGLLGLAVGLINPIAGKGAALLCKLDSRPHQQERHPALPDLAVLVRAGTSRGYETHTEQDSAYAVFRREFVIPTAAIPPDGLAFEVIDRDGNQYDTIGRVRVFRQDLVAVAFSPQRLLVLEDRRGGLDALELVVEPYAQGPEVTQTTMPTREGTTKVPFRPLRAGEVVEVRAFGRYQVGTWNDSVIDPRGFEGGALREYNFKNSPFATAPHGSGLAVIAAGDARQGLVVAPCSSTVARVGGTLLVGVNDDDPDNNRGQIQFTVGIRPPTPMEWLGQEPPPCGAW